MESELCTKKEPVHSAVYTAVVSVDDHVWDIIYEFTGSSVAESRCEHKQASKDRHLAYSLCRRETNEENTSTPARSELHRM